MASSSVRRRRVMLHFVVFVWSLLMDRPIQALIPHHHHPVPLSRRCLMRQQLPSSSSSSSLVLLSSSSSTNDDTATTTTTSGRNADDKDIIVEPPFLTRSNATSASLEPAAAAKEEESQLLLFDWNKQWYPVLPLASLDNFEKSTVAVTMLNRPLVVWKNSQGKYVIFDDACPHRRAPLSTGRVVVNSNDECRLACRYHGWEFNASGVCTKIPMLLSTTTQEQQQQQQQNDNTKSNKFRVTTYPTQQAGGLLWVFMDPTVSSPPPLPAKVLLEKADNDDSVKSPLFGYNTEAVSYLSLIENSFDPAHAPFTHAGTLGFSPANAIPMQEYNIIEPLSLDGFQVQHSDYQKSSFFGTSSSSSLPNVTTTFTKRTFIPPCTTVFQGPFMSGILYFCPSKPGETNVITHFSLTMTNTSKGQQSFKKRLVAFVNKKIPASYKSYVADWVHFRQWTSDSQWRFASQDRVTMQGQDLRKLIFFRQHHHGQQQQKSSMQQQWKWDDLVPTTSDVGVSVFQKWMRRYGRGGPFSMLDMTQAASAGERTMSIWEKHANNCEICQRVMKRLGAMENKAKKWSIRSFCASAIGALYAVIAASSFFWRMLTRGTIIATSASTTAASATALPSHVIAALSWSILSLVASMGFQRVAVASNQLQQRVLNTPNMPSIKMMNIYQDDV